MIRKTLYRIDKVLSFFEEWTLFVAVTAALFTLFISVVTRYTITYTLTWPEELVREVIIYTTFIGCASAVKTRSLIRVDALPNIFKRLKKPLEIVSNVSLFVFAVFITYYGAKMAHFQYRMEMKTVILQIPQVVLYCILPLMGVLMIFRLIHVLYEDITGESIQDAEKA
jgi:TRAP-type C4-dicarboxylate transport system permease small subunit